MCTLYTHLEVLISEFGTINALAPSPIVVGEVSSLAHELGDHPGKEQMSKVKSYGIFLQRYWIIGYFNQNKQRPDQTDL